MNPLEREAAERPFDEPWQAQAFALAVQLHRQGAFTWMEWSKALAAEIAAAGAHETYFACWVAALEGLAGAKHLTPPTELACRKLAWEKAYRVTPHGLPVELLSD